MHWLPHQSTTHAVRVAGRRDAAETWALTIRVVRRTVLTGADPGRQG
jgi:hypothetical protein